MTTRTGTPVKAPPDIRRYARHLGVRLELEYLAGTLLVVPYDAQTGMALSDLPGMTEDGGWCSWEDSLTGLRALRRESEDSSRQFRQ